MLWYVMVCFDILWNGMLWFGIILFEVWSGLWYGWYVLVYGIIWYGLGYAVVKYDMV